MTRGLMRWAKRVALAGTTAGCLACGAVYPEVATPVRPAPAGRELEPPPPEDLLFITFKRATIPAETRDGRKWDSVGGNAPDPFARLIVDDREVIKTPTEANTLKPTWPNQKRANYSIPVGASVRVELWNNNALNDDPICHKQVRRLHEQASVGEVEVRCDSGARVYLGVEPAHAKMGLGFYYELRSEDVAVSRLFAHGPAAREGLEKGDVIVEIQGKPAKKLDAGEVRSLINANAQVGVKLRVRRRSADEAVVEVKNGPIYPLDEEPLEVE